MEKQRGLLLYDLGSETSWKTKWGNMLSSLYFADDKAIWACVKTQNLFDRLSSSLQISLLFLGL
jgi:hypothetical protein